jgi:hypothetical protein
MHPQAVQQYIYPQAVQQYTYPQAVQQYTYPQAVQQYTCPQAVQQYTYPQANPGKVIMQAGCVICNAQLVAWLANIVNVKSADFFNNLELHSGKAPLLISCNLCIQKFSDV